MKKRRELLRSAEQGRLSTDLESDRWIDNELESCKFKDARHGKRLPPISSESCSRSIPAALLLTVFASFFLSALGLRRR